VIFRTVGGAGELPCFFIIPLSIWIFSAYLLSQNHCRKASPMPQVWFQLQTLLKPLVCMGFALPSRSNIGMFDIAIQHGLPIVKITSLLAPGLHDLA
jgi:hypothetical protein